MPLTDKEYRQAKPKDKIYAITDGYGMYLEIHAVYGDGMTPSP